MDRLWKPKLVNQVEEMKIHRFIGQNDLEYKKSPRLTKYAETSKEIKGLEVTVRLLCGEYPIGENLERTKTKATKKCEICEHTYKISVDDTVEHFWLRQEP